MNDTEANQLIMKDIISLCSFEQSVPSRLHVTSIGGHFLTLQKSPDVDDATEWQIERFLQLLL